MFASSSTAPSLNTVASSNRDDPDAPQGSPPGEQKPPAGPWIIPDADYYAAQEADTLARRLIIKIRQWRDERIPMAARARINWRMMYSLDNGRAAWQDNLYPEGEMGEKVRLRVNIARSLIQHVLVNTNSVDPAIAPLAKNSDAQSTRQITVARSVADDFMKNKGGKYAADTATEYAEVLDEGYVEGEWDYLGGGIYAAPGGDRPVYRGSPHVNVLTPMDVFFDLAAPRFYDLSDMVIRKWRNRHDLIADFPEAKDRLLAAQRKVVTEDTQHYELPNPANYAMADSELVEVFTYYHRKSPAMQYGRRLVYLADGTWLEDGPLPYETIPVWRVVPSEVINCAFGYGPMTSLGSAQEAFNKMLSMACTTLFTHGVSNLIVAKGANLEASDVAGGNRIFEVDPIGGSLENVIKPLQLTDLPPQVMEFANALQAMMELDLGVNKIVRGDPGAVTAGVAISLFQAMSQQFQGPLEESRANLIKSMVAWCWEAYRVHSESMPQLVQLVGKSNRQSLVAFYGGSDAAAAAGTPGMHLQGIERLEVSLGNPLTRTPAGKVQMVQLLKQDGQPLPPQLIADVMNTGNIEAAIKPDSDEQDLIRAENEMLLDGMAPTVLLGQDDALHIFGHADVGMDPNLDPGVQRNLEMHLQQHLEKMSQGDMILLARRGMLQQGFANPMFGAPPGAPGAPAPQGQKPPPSAKSGKPEGKAPERKPEGPPGARPPNPAEPAPIPGTLPQQQVPTG